MCQYTIHFTSPQSLSPIPFDLYSLRSVLATVRLVGLHRPDRDAQTSVIAGRVRNAGINPDAPGPVDAVGAGDEPGAVEGQITRAVELEGGELAIPWRGFVPGDVSKFSLAYSISASRSLLVYSRRKRRIFVLGG